MKKVDFTKILLNLVCYIGGLLLIAVGINISKMSRMGISAVSSIPRALELKWGFTLGTTTLIIYCVLVLLQFIILRKKTRLINVLGIALTFAFSFLVDLTGTDPKAFGHLLAKFPQPSNYGFQFLYEVIAILVIGLGVFLYLRPHWIPMPAEGLADAISQASGKNFGDCKTFVDVSMIVIALLIQLIFLGGFKSFTSENVVVREGTILLAVFVGQIVKLLIKLTGKKKA